MIGPKVSMSFRRVGTEEEMSSLKVRRRVEESTSLRSTKGDGKEWKMSRSSVGFGLVDSKTCAITI